MKKNTIIIGALLIVLNLSVYSQTGGVGIADGTPVVDASAMLDIQSTTKGILIPRMLEIERAGITTPATGLMIYQTDGTPGYYFYDGTAWKSIGAGVLGINDLTDGKVVNDNLFLGGSVGTLLNGGTLNTGIGSHAQNNLTGGDENTAVGYNALYTNEDGNGNSAFGPYALYTSTGTRNTAIGDRAGILVTTGINNTFIGWAAGDNQTTGNNNTFLGFSAGHSQTTGDNNIVIGNNITVPNLTGSNQLNIGDIFHATGTDSSVSIGLGYQNNAPNSTLDVGGSMALPVDSGGTYTLTADDYTYFLTVAQTVTLPTAVGIAGRIYIIKRVETNGNGTVATSGGETIDGNATFTLQLKKYLIVQSNGRNWYVIGQN